MPLTQFCHVAQVALTAFATNLVFTVSGIGGKTGLVAQVVVLLVPLTGKLFSTGSSLVPLTQI